eukprot:3822827-Prymnesium_polylepis.1
MSFKLPEVCVSGGALEFEHATPSTRTRLLARRGANRRASHSRNGLHAGAEDDGVGQLGLRLHRSPESHRCG